MCAPTTYAYAITDASAVETVQISSQSSNRSMFVKALTQSYCRCRNDIILGIVFSDRPSSHQSSLENISRETKAWIHSKNKNQASVFNPEVSASLQLRKVWVDFSHAIMVCVYDGRNPGSF